MEKKSHRDEGCGDDCALCNISRRGTCTDWIKCEHCGRVIYSAEHCKCQWTKEELCSYIDELIRLLYRRK